MAPEAVLDLVAVRADFDQEDQAQVRAATLSAADPTAGLPRSAPSQAKATDLLVSFLRLRRALRK
jgi:hypothetical protein